MTSRRHLHTGQIREILERAIVMSDAEGRYCQDYGALARDLEDVLAEVAPDCPGCREIHESYPTIRHDHHPACANQGKCATCETGTVPYGCQVGAICGECYHGDGVKKSDAS